MPLKRQHRKNEAEHRQEEPKWDPSLKTPLFKKLWGKFSSYAKFYAGRTLVQVSGRNWEKFNF
jgi:hypothetical protein